MRITAVCCTLVALVGLLASAPVLAQNVKITPIGSHAGELCANEPVTEGGKLRPKSHTAALIKRLKPPAHLAISGRTMEFDGQGKCVAGCGP